MRKKTVKTKERANRAPKLREELLKGIGKRLKKLRETFETTQTAFAASIGVTISSYNQWELERIMIPRNRRLQICRLYNIRRDWLEFGAGKMFDFFDEPETDEQSRYFERLEVAQKFLDEMSEDFRRALYALLVKEFEE